MTKRGDNLATERLNLKPSERDSYGVTVTIRNTNRKMRTIAEQGRVTDAIRRVAARIDAMEGTWKIVTISTPATIFADMQGSRDTENDPVPELNLLSKIGRQDLSEHGMTDKAIRNRRNKSNRTPKAA